MRRHASLEVRLGWISQEADVDIDQDAELESEDDLEDSPAAASHGSGQDTVLELSCQHCERLLCRRGMRHSAVSPLFSAFFFRCSPGLQRCDRLVFHGFQASGAGAA